MKDKKTNAFFVERPSEITDEIIEEVTKLVEVLEKQFKIRCAVVYNPHSIGFSGYSVALTLLVFPVSGFEDDAFEEGVKGCLKHREDELFSGGDRSWQYSILKMSLSGCKQWFERFKDDPGAFPLKDMAMGANLISFVLWGQEMMGKVHCLARDFFGEGILEYWQKELFRRKKERDKKIIRRIRQHNNYLRIRRQLLNMHEMDELRFLLSKISANHKKTPIKLIVALDASGRPAGKALKWFLDDKTPIVFVDPHPLVKEGTMFFPEAERVLKEEIPHLHELWKNQPERIQFIDDQTGYGHTADTLRSFTEFLSGRDVFHLAVISQYQGDNTPSWLRNRELQGLQLQEDNFTFLSLERPTDQSKNFYNRLKRRVLSWK